MPNQLAQLSTAIDRHEAYERIDPDNLPLQLALADLYRANGQHDEAISRYAKCESLGADPAQIDGRRALTLLAAGEYEKAGAILHRLLSQSPQDAALLHNLGISLQGQQRWQESAVALSEAEGLGLRIPSNYAALARSLIALGDLMGAQDACARWIRHAQTGDAYGLMAALMVETGDIAGAEPTAKAALRLDPDNIEAHVALGTLNLERQDLTCAREHFQSALHANHRSPSAWFGIGLSYLQEREFDLSLKAIHKAHAIAPKDVGIAVAMGWVSILSDDLATAVSSFEKAIDTDRNFAECHGGLAVALVLLGRTADAERCIEIARRLNRDGFGAEFAHAILLEANGLDHEGEKRMTALLMRPVREGGPTLADHLRNAFTLRPQSSPPVAQPSL